MDQSLSDALSASISSYANHFAMMSSFGAALFGVSVFVAARLMGLVKNDELLAPRGSGLVIASAVFGLLVVAIGYIANNAIANYHVDLLRSGPTFCAFPANKSPTTFFMDCYRNILKTLVQAALLLSALGIFCMLTWIILNLKKRR